MKNFPIPRLDRNPDLHACLLKYCRIREGEIWEDPEGNHRVGCLDAADQSAVLGLMGAEKASLAIQDPPYNFAAFEKVEVDHFEEECLADADLQALLGALPETGNPQPALF